VSDNFGGSGHDLFGSKVYDYNVYDANFGGPLIKRRDWAASS